MLVCLYCLVENVPVGIDAGVKASHGFWMLLHVNLSVRGRNHDAGLVSVLVRSEKVHVGIGVVQHNAQGFSHATEGVLAEILWGLGDEVVGELAVEFFGAPGLQPGLVWFQRNTPLFREELSDVSIHRSQGGAEVDLALELAIDVDWATGKSDNIAEEVVGDAGGGVKKKVVTS